METKKIVGRSSAPPPLPLYEQNELAEIIGGTLRPGGIRLTSEMVSYWNPQPGATVLDIGCGPGHTLAHLSSVFGLDTTGLDPSGAMLAKAANRSPNSTLLQGTATSIPCEGQSFNGVISECSLSLTGDIGLSLKEMYRVLQPGGTLLLSDIYLKDNTGSSPDLLLPRLESCISHAQPLDTIEANIRTAGFSLTLLRDRSDLLKQLAGQIIFNCGSLDTFWQLFMDKDQARQTCSSLAKISLGYYVLIAAKGDHNG